MKLSDQIISSAKETISNEAEAIANLENFIDEEFTKAVEIIYRSQGRVVVTGIGKSAIIANKIVATLNSTGTPSIFMHALWKLVTDASAMGYGSVFHNCKRIMRTYDSFPFVLSYAKPCKEAFKQPLKKS